MPLLEISFKKVQWASSVTSPSALFSDGESPGSEDTLSPLERPKGPGVDPSPLKRPARDQVKPSNTEVKPSDRLA